MFDNVSIDVRKIITILRSSLEFNVFGSESQNPNILMLDLDQTRFSDAQFSCFFLFYLVLSLASCYIHIISL